jgi:hypothetical protein
MQRLEVSDGISLHIFCSCNFGQDDHNHEALPSSRLERRNMLSWVCSRSNVLLQPGDTHGGVGAYEACLCSVDPESGRRSAFS